jgi:MFS family permease
MQTPDQAPAKFSTTVWLIILIASIGFLFDTYELLMTPLVAAPAIAELLEVPINNPLVTIWVGRLLWIAALCGGIFGLWGGWLVDRFGRKRIMAISIFVYSLSPFCAAYATNLPTFIFFRSTTFIGVCVEFVAAITWLAEVFQDRKQKEKWLGITQMFASLGGVLVTAVSIWISQNIKSLPQFGLPLSLGSDLPGVWRYTLMTGILPAIPIAILLPFVPESQIWKERRKAGTLKRPSFVALFSPELIRVTIVTTILSACAYGIAFGALQITVARVTPGLPEMAPVSKKMAPLRKESEALNAEFNKLQPDDPARNELRAKIIANAREQKPFGDEIKEYSDKVQLHQEMGGLIGRILLAVFVIIGMKRVLLLKLFQIPLLIMVPLTYFVFFGWGGQWFLIAYGLCGLLTVGQFSYFGEYLPKVFPMHLRGTGGSFATNVGGRMIGTSMALVTTSLVAPMIAAGSDKGVLPIHVAQAAGYVATVIALIALIVGFFLPEPKGEIQD